MERAGRSPGGELSGRSEPRLFDSHCHLQDQRIRSQLGSLLEDASSAGVEWLVVNGTCEDDWEEVKAQVEKHPQLVPSFGLHPWYVAKRSPDWLARLRHMLEAFPSAALGEAGLDKAWKDTGADMETQVEVLKQQLQLAQELQRPIALHCVRAYGHVHDLLREMAPFPAGVILHSFQGPPEMISSLAATGAYFSISGSITSLKPEKAGKIIREIPLERLLLETDSPDALPKVDPACLVWVPGDSAAPARVGNRTWDESVPSKCEDGEEEVVKGGCCRELEEEEKRERREEGWRVGDSGGEEETGNDRKGRKGGGFQNGDCVGRGALNHPANLAVVASIVSSYLEGEEAEVRQRTFENGIRLFSFKGSLITSQSQSRNQGS